MTETITEVCNPLISKYEKKFLFSIANLTYKHLHSDVVTVLAILSSVAGFVLYLGATENPFNYLLACICVFAHYVFDGIDGKIAKLRDMDRKVGRYIDKISDGTCSIFFISGFCFAVARSLIFVMVCLFFFSMIYSAYLYYFFKKYYDVKVGGTESRILLIVLNLILYYYACC